MSALIVKKAEHIDFKATPFNSNDDIVVALKSKTISSLVESQEKTYHGISIAKVMNDLTATGDLLKVAFGTTVGRSQSGRNMATILTSYNTLVAETHSTTGVFELGSVKCIKLHGMALRIFLTDPDNEKYKTSAVTQLSKCVDVATDMSEHCNRLIKLSNDLAEKASVALELTVASMETNHTEKQALQKSIDNANIQKVNYSTLVEEYASVVEELKILTEDVRKEKQDALDLAEKQRAEEREDRKEKEKMANIERMAEIQAVKDVEKAKIDALQKEKDQLFKLQEAKIQADIKIAEQAQEAAKFDRLIQVFGMASQASATALGVAAGVAFKATPAGQAAGIADGLNSIVARPLPIAAVPAALPSLLSSTAANVATAAAAPLSPTVTTSLPSPPLPSVTPPPAPVATTTTTVIAEKGPAEATSPSPATSQVTTELSLPPGTMSLKEKQVFDKGHELNMKLLEMRKLQRENTAALQSTLENLKGMKVEQDTLKVTCLALQAAISALGKIQTTFTNVKTFWNGVQRHCQHLAESSKYAVEMLELGIKDMFVDAVQSSAIDWLALAKINQIAHESMGQVRSDYAKIMCNLPSMDDAQRLIDEEVPDLISRQIEQIEYADK